MQGKPLPDWLHNDVHNTQYVTQDTMFHPGKEALKSMTENEATRPLLSTRAFFSQHRLLMPVGHEIYSQREGGYY